MNFGNGFQQVVFRRISGPALVPILILAIPLLLLLGLMGVAFLGAATLSGAFRGTKIGGQRSGRFDRRAKNGVSPWQSNEVEVIDVVSVKVDERKPD